ncbi:MAG: methyltransferase domain-containing protein [Enhygromyxa sp.]
MSSEGEPQAEPQGRREPETAGSEASPRPGVRSPLERLAGPIDLRSRTAAASQSGAQTGLSSAGMVRASSSATGPFPAGSSWSRLIDSLVGDVLLEHVPGCRVLDLGYGSPEIAEWIGERIGDHLSIVEKGALENPTNQPIADSSGFLPASEFLDAAGNLVLPTEEEDEGLRLVEYRDASFDVVYCLRTFPHLGYDTESSERLGVQLLREAARVTADGGTVFVQIANSRSLRGFIEGVRNPITVVSRRRMILGDRYGLTRWDTLPRFMGFLPPELELVGVHGLGVLIPHNATLQIPIVGRVLTRLEWRLRDMGVARRFGAQLLVVLRRLHRSDPSLAKGGPQRSSLSTSLIEALSSSTRKIS